MPGRISLGSIFNRGLLTGESLIPLFRAWLLFLEAHCPNELFSIVQIFSRGDGTLGTEYRLRGEREKVSGGVDLLRADLSVSSRKRTKRHFRDFTYTVGGWLL